MQEHASHRRAFSPITLTTGDLSIRALPSGLHSNRKGKNLARKLSPSLCSFSHTFSIPSVNLGVSRVLLPFDFPSQTPTRPLGLLWSKSYSVRILYDPGPLRSSCGHIPKSGKSKITRTLFCLLCLHFTFKHCSLGYTIRSVLLR